MRPTALDPARLAMRLCVAAAFLTACVGSLTPVVLTGWAKLLHSGGQLVAITSGSMSPGIESGDLLAVRAVPAGELAVGQVVTVHTGGLLVTHRIVSISAESTPHLTTKGDANASIDPFSVPVDDVIGVVDGHIAGAGKPLKVLQSPWGKLATYGPVLLLLLLWQVKVLFGRTAEPVCTPGSVVRLPSQRVTAARRGGKHRATRPRTAVVSASQPRWSEGTT